MLVDQQMYSARLVRLLDHIQPAVLEPLSEEEIRICTNNDLLCLNTGQSVGLVRLYVINEGVGIDFAEFGQVQSMFNVALTQVAPFLRPNRIGILNFAAVPEMLEDTTHWTGNQIKNEF